MLGNFLEHFTSVFAHALDDFFYVIFYGFCCLDVVLLISIISMIFRIKMGSLKVVILVHFLQLVLQIQLNNVYL
jgi:hypothetical protein